MNQNQSFFHLHLISDSTGETLIAASRAVTSQYKHRHAVEHLYPLIRNKTQLERVTDTLDKSPGIVLYTITDPDIGSLLQSKCRDLGLPCISLLEPIFQAFQSYMGPPTERKVGAQHALDTDYFSRIEALNFTMMHDDGVIPENPEDADIYIIGISRTSKTPTSIYLANRGIKVANIPLVPGVELSPDVLNAKEPMVVALVASTDRIYQVRQNRLLGLNAADKDSEYTDRASIAKELADTKKLCARNGWSTIDVSRRSIEETAAAIMKLHEEHQEKLS